MSTQTPSKKGGTRLLPVVLGGAVLAAAIVTSLVLRLQPPEAMLPAVQPEPPPAPAAPRAHTSPEASSSTQARLLALERRMAELAARPAPAPVALPAEEPRYEEEEPPAPPPDMKEQVRLAQEAFEQQVDAALSEPLDPLWSSRTGYALQGELHALRGEDRYEVSKIDCRNHSCVAELSFPTHAEARTSLSRLVVNLDLQGCASTGAIDPSEDLASPSRMRLLLDCDRSQEAR